MNILVVAAHPDDEVIGCGGTMAKHAADGDQVYILIVAEGATSRLNVSKAVVSNLAVSAQASASILGANPPKLLEFPANRLDTIARLDVIKKIEAYVKEIKPTIVYTHHGGDLNIDHRIVHEAVVTACRPLPGSNVYSIYSFEAVSSTEYSSRSIGQPFKPTHHVDVTLHLATKIQAIKCYETEMRPFPHPRSTDALIALATVRGSQVGMAAAEAFQTELSLRF